MAHHLQTQWREAVMENHWEHFHHLADIGIKGIGTTIDEAFRQAALALSAVVLDPKKIPSSKSTSIVCQHDGDMELLLFDWLNTVVFEMDVHKLLFGNYEVSISAHELQATAFGSLIDEITDDLGPEIKGATFTELQVTQLNTGLWIAQCVLDV